MRFEWLWFSNMKPAIARRIPTNIGRRSLQGRLETKLRVSMRGTLSGESYPRAAAAEVEFHRTFLPLAQSPANNAQRMLSKTHQGQKQEAMHIDNA